MSARSSYRPLNILVAIGCDFSDNLEFGLYDKRFLANIHIGHHSSDNGHTSANLANYSGRVYVVVAGQQAGALTNAPSGTDADDTLWYFNTVGSSVFGRPWAASFDNARLLFNGTAPAPTGTFAVGDIKFRRDAALGGAAFNYCTAAGAGTWAASGIVAGVQAATQADAAAATAVAAVAAPTKAEYDALLADIAAIRTALNGAPAKLKAARLMA